MKAGEQPRNYHIDCQMLTNEGPISVRLDFVTWVDDETGERGCEIQIGKKFAMHKIWATLNGKQARDLASRLKAAAKWMRAQP